MVWLLWPSLWAKLICYFILVPVSFSFSYVSCFRRQEKTVMKLIVDSETDKVLGASMCGPDAPEIMQVCLTKHNLCYWYKESAHNHMKNFCWSCSIFFTKITEVCLKPSYSMMILNLYIIFALFSLIIWVLLVAIDRVLQSHSNVEQLRHNLIAQ